ncbi:MAG: Lrp/AsnC family transcriptional regulator [Candidatus Methanomethylophilaceae archaeon]|nr:Lrp/AsnC family transcriptional regulator [Candidatus Methanomethylophilaceae archaeon]
MALTDYDELDKRIIELLCRSSQGSYRQIAKQLGVHPTTLIQRVKALESKGVINGYRASIDYARLGFDYMGIVSVSADADAIKEIAGIPQVVSVFEVTGDSDCMAWIACEDREEFSAVVKRIASLDGVRRTSTSVIMGVEKDPFEFVPPILGERSRLSQLSKKERAMRPCVSPASEMRVNADRGGRPLRSSWS